MTKSFLPFNREEESFGGTLSSKSIGSVLDFFTGKMGLLSGGLGGFFGVVSSIGGDSGPLKFGGREPFPLIGGEKTPLPLVALVFCSGICSFSGLEPVPLTVATATGACGIFV